MLRTPQWTHNQPTGSDRLHSHGTTPHAAKIPLNRQFLRIGTRQPETCWATYKGEINIILSDIQLVSYSTLNYDARSATHQIFFKFCIWIFSENLSDNTSFIMVWQEKRVLNMKTFMTFKHLWYYLAEFFSYWEKFQTNAVHSQNTRFTFNIFFLMTAPFVIMWQLWFIDTGHRKQYNAAKRRCYLHVG